MKKTKKQEWLNELINKSLFEGATVELLKTDHYEFKIIVNFPSFIHHPELPKNYGFMIQVISETGFELNAGDITHIETLHQGSLIGDDLLDYLEENPRNFLHYFIDLIENIEMGSALDDLLRDNGIDGTK